MFFNVHEIRFARTIGICHSSNRLLRLDTDRLAGRDSKNSIDQHERRHADCVCCLCVNRNVESNRFGEIDNSKQKGLKSSLQKSAASSTSQDRRPPALLEQAGNTNNLAYHVFNHHFPPLACLRYDSPFHPLA